MKTLPELLQHTVSDRPQQIAVEFGDEKVDYQTLWSKVQQAASFIKSQGVGKGDHVALLLNNSVEYIACYYGILVSGAVAVPMNTGAKYKDFSNWLQHANAALVLVDQKIPEIGRSIDELKNITKLFDSSELFVSEDADISSSEIAALSADDFACILYTSGTTGNPKGVMLTHSNLANNVQSILDALPMSQGDRFLNVLPFYYSYGNSVLHTTLVSGATLILENSTMYPKVIVETMVERSVNGFAGVPSTYALLTSRVALEDYQFPHLKYILQAGGAMPISVIETTTQQLCSELYVMYGQTEAAARISCLNPSYLSEKLGSVGLPIQGVELQVRGKDGSVCEPLEVGEVFVSGDNISPGYWNNKEATDKTFIDGWLKTGDLGYKDEDGFLFLKGRRSDMIKTGANRVSPNEIEEVLAQHPDIEEAAVVGEPDELLGQIIAAHLVPKKNASLNIRAIKKHCLDNLAGYKIPKNIYEAEALPKTASGKVIKHKLNREQSV